MVSFEKIKDKVYSILACIVLMALLGFGIYSLIKEEHWIILSLLIIGLVSTPLIFFYFRCRIGKWLQKSISI